MLKGEDPAPDIENTGNQMHSLCDPSALQVLLANLPLQLVFMMAMGEMWVIFAKGPRQLVLQPRRETT
jgi:hypothetical protein